MIQEALLTLSISERLILGKNDIFCFKNASFSTHKFLYDDFNKKI